MFTPPNILIKSDAALLSLGFSRLKEPGSFMVHLCHIPDALRVETVCAAPKPP